MMCRGAGGWRDGFGWCACPCLDLPSAEQPLRAAQARLTVGRSHCDLCGGRGGRRVNGKWFRCECTKLTKLDKQVQKALNAVGTQGEQLPLIPTERGKHE